MSAETQSYSMEILSQLKLSKVNGFPFFPYTGLRIWKQTDTEIQLIALKNPGKVHIVSVQYEKGTDTYTISFLGKNNVTKTHSDIYVDGMVELIISTMGVN